MDLKFITESMPFNAYNQSREAEMVNQARQAQAVQMLQEARLKAEMQPYDIASKEAQTENYLAMARGTGHYAKTKEIDPRRAPQAQQVMLENYQPILGSVIEPLRAAQKGGKLTPQMEEEGRVALSAIADELEASGLKSRADILRKGFGPAMALYDQEIMAKQMAQRQTGRERNAANITITDKRIASHEKIAAARNAALKEIEAEKAKGEKGNLRYLAEQYQAKADALEMSGDTEQADMYYGMARRAAALTAMKNPAAGKQSINTGEVAGLPTVTPVAPTANQPERSIEVTRDPVTGKLVRK